MGNSYPDRTNARGIWGIDEIYKNSITHKTFPRGATKTAISLGNVTADETITNAIDTITLETTGNASDFGDLSVARGLGAAFSNAIRTCFGGGQTPSVSDVVDFVNPRSTGNAVDFGNLTAAKSQNFGCSNSTRGFFGEEPLQLIKMF